MGLPPTRSLKESFTTLLALPATDPAVAKLAIAIEGLVARWPQWGERSEEFVLILKACGQLLVKPLADPLVIHVTRVTCHILLARADLFPNIRQDHGVVRIFRSYGLIPLKLKFCEIPAQARQFADTLDHLARSLGCADLDAARVVFAACAYPQKLSQMGWPLANWRTAALGDFLAQLSVSQSVFSAIDSRLTALLGPTAWSPSRTRELLGDLAGGKAGSSSTDSVEVDGAALYLGTCSDAEIERIHRIWASEAELVCTFRSYFGSPPSSYAAISDGGAPPGTSLSVAIRDIGTDRWNACRRVEEHSRGVAKDWPADFRTAEHFTLAWQGIHSRWLNSGFPYFAFRADFHTWWVDYFARFRFDRTNSLDFAVVGDEGAETNGHASLAVDPSHLYRERSADDEINLDWLRVCREGYRVVRTTFFSRDDRNHERTRRAVDGLWRYFLEKELTNQAVEWGSLNPLIARIAAEEKLAFGKIETAYNKLRLRMWAYMAGRTSSDPLHDIPRRPRPRGYTAGKAHPLAGDATVLTIAALARMAPEDFTPLWGFAAHVFLRPALNAIYDSDTWSLDQYLAETRIWLEDAAFVRTLAYGREMGRRVDTLCDAALRSGSMKGFFNRATGCGKSTGVKESGTGQPVEAESDRSAAAALIREITGCRVFNVALDRTVGKEWIGWPDTAPTHLVIPVWYLAMAERLDTAAVAIQMGVKLVEIEELTRRIRAYAAARDTIADYLVGKAVSPAAMQASSEILQACKPSTLQRLKQDLRALVSTSPPSCRDDSKAAAL